MKCSDILWSLYTDGGCLGNPGVGAWAFCVVKGKKPPLGDPSPGVPIFKESGGEQYTTNNRMELCALIQGFFAVQRLCVNCPELQVYTDSQYARQGITQWIHKWKVNRWKTADGKAVKNQDLWEELYNLSVAFSPTWHWVKGHSGNYYNELCDQLVQEKMQEIQQSLC